MASKSPCPFVYWGQNSSTVYIRVALRDVQENPDIELSPDEISFTATGIGAHGKSTYEFKLEPYGLISPIKSKMKISGSDVLLEVSKHEETTKEKHWPRLVKTTVKYPWIKPDFDRMEISDDEEQNEESDKKRLEDEYMKKLTAEIDKTQADAMDEIRRNYLFTYSLFQFIAYAFIAVRLIYGIISEEGYRGYNDISTVLLISQVLSLMEVVHPLIGVVKTGFLSPLMQACGRNFILLVLLWNEPALHSDWSATYLALSWSLAEIIRYPFYMLSSMKLELRFLTWLRYTMWVVLYPAGVFCEFVVTWRSIPLFLESEKFSISLPNSWNFSFSLVYYLYCHLVILPFGMAYMMSHMTKQRRKKFGIVGTSKASRAKKTN